MSDGDTLWIADGTYTEGRVSGQGCGGSTFFYIGPNDACPTYGCEVRTSGAPGGAVFVGGALGAIVNRTSGWVIEGIKTVADRGIAQCDSSDIVYRDMELVATGIHTINHISGGENVSLERVTSYRDGRPCELSGEGSARAFTFKDIRDVTVTGSYIGHIYALMTLTNVDDFQLRQSRMEHWANHGIVLKHKTRNVLIENNIMSGVPACSTAEVAGPRLFDLAEASDVTIRNNTVVGHGYSPRSATISYFHFGNAYAGCSLDASEPGRCEYDTDVVCTANDIPKLDGVRYSATSSQCPTRAGSDPWSPRQRCSGICELENIKFYNNLIYDLRDTGEPEAGTRYIDWLSQPPWSMTTNLVLDGNYYGGGVERWICTGSNGDRTTLEEWRQAQCLGGPNPDPSSIVGECSGSPRRACGADGDCAGGQVCLHRAPGFIDYAGEDYRPTADAVQVDAGVGGIDAEGVRRCATVDVLGRSRLDGRCDIGAFELDAGATPTDGIVFHETTTLTWNEAAEAEGYSVYRGSLGQLDDGDGDGLPDLLYGVCRSMLDPDPDDATFEDAQRPLPGRGFFYLVSPRGDGVDLDLGSTSEGLLRLPAVPCAATYEQGPSPDFPRVPARDPSDGYGQE